MGSGISCNHGLPACLPVPIETFWYNTISSFPPFLAEPIADAAAVTEPPLNDPPEADVAADSITPFCKAASNAFAPPSLPIQ